MAAPTPKNLDVLVDNFIKDGLDSAIQDITTGINCGHYKILQVVECLGPTLVSSDVELRVKGTQLLAEVLQLLPKDVLSEKEVDVFVKFFCDRLKDHHSITPHILNGTHALVQNIFASTEHIRMVLQGIFQEIHIQSLAQSERRHMYHTFEYLLEQRIEFVKSMGPDFVFGYIQATDGEKDPRNLVIAFKCVTIITKDVPLGTFAEDLFEVVACYFPIDFTPPSNDPHGITSDMLKSGLRACLASCSDFAEFGLPLILEKLTSSIQSAKVDSLLTVAACADPYSEKINEYTGSLWASIRREVFSGGSEVLEQAALTALAAIVKTLSKQVTAKEKQSALDEFVQEIFQDVKRYLTEPEQRLVEPSGKLLRCAGSASGPAQNVVLTTVLPFLLEEFNHRKQVSERRAIIGELNKFIEMTASASENEDTVLEQYKGDLYALYISLLVHSNPQLCHLGVQGTMGLIKLQGILSADEIDHCSQYFHKISFESDKLIRADALKGLGAMCPKMTSGGITRLCSTLTSVIHTGTSSDVEDIDKEQSVLEVMSSCATCTEVVKIIVPFLLEKIKSAEHKDANCKEVPVYRSMCCHLQTIISNNVNTAECKNFFADEILSQLVQMCTDASVNRTDSVLNLLDILVSLSASIKSIVCVLNGSDAVNILSTTLELFLDGKISNSMEDSSTFEPFNLQSVPTQTQMLHVFTAVVSSLPKSVTLKRGSEVIPRLLEVASRCQHSQTSEIAAQCLASLINKFTDDELLQNTVTSIRNTINNVYESDNSSVEDQQRAVCLMIWTTKALLLRSHKLQKQWIDLLLNTLNHSYRGTLAAEGFATILCDCETVMRPEQHADVKFMYKQRLFLMTVDSLTNGFNKAESDNRVPYLVAISHLLRYVTREAVSSHLPQLLPLLIQCLQHEGENLWLSTLSTLSLMIADMPDLIAKYVDELISHMLRLAQYKNKMTVRISSLVCLRLLATLPETLLLPHKSHVTKTLGAVLDDHKRLVRKEAVQTRTQWFLLGEPGS